MPCPGDHVFEQLFVLLIHELLFRRRARLVVVEVSDQVVQPVAGSALLANEVRHLPEHAFDDEGDELAAFLVVLLEVAAPQPNADVLDDVVDIRWLNGPTTSSDDFVGDPRQVWVDLAKPSFDVGWAGGNAVGTGFVLGLHVSTS